MATRDIASGNRISKSDSSTEAQAGSKEKEYISDALEISETYPINATSGRDVNFLVEITLDKAAPNTSIEENAMDQQATVEIEAEASETPKEHEEKVFAKQGTLHREVSALADSMGSKLDVSENSPSVQEPECSKQSEIQSTSRAAYQTAEGDPSEEMKKSLIGRTICKKFAGEYYEGKVVGYDSVTKWFKISYYDGDEEEMDLVEVQLWVDDHDYPIDKRYPTDKAADENSKSPSKKAKKSGVSAPKKRKPSRATTMNPKTPQTPIKSAKKSREAMPTRSTPDLSIDENARSVQQSTKTTPESSQKRKPSRATTMIPKTSQTPIQSAKKSREAMPTRATPDLSIDENAQSVQQSTKTTPKSSQEKCSSSPPRSPMELTTGHMETAGSATKKTGRQS